MISVILEKSKTRPECANNYLFPRLDTLIPLFRECEKCEPFMQAIQRVELPKGAYLLREGCVSGHTWFLVEGTARLFIRRGDVEITDTFFLPCEFVDSYGYSSLGIPSGVNIQLLSKSILYKLSWVSLRKLQAEFPILSDIEHIILGCLTLSQEERICSLNSLSAIEYYEQIMAERPQLFRLIALKHMASYMGISIWTLSRIRTQKM